MMRSVATDARKGLEPEYECTSLAGPHCRTHGPTGDLLSDELSASSAEDGSLLIQLDDTTLGKDGKIDLAKVIEMFGGAMAKKARETAAGTNEAGTNEAGAAEVGDDAAVREAREIAAKIGIGRANGVLEMHSPLAAGRRLRPDAVVGRGGEGMASTPSRDDRKVEFINAREATSALYWLDFDGNEVHYVDLPPGMTTMMSTFGSHVWVSRDMATNAAVAAYAVTARKPGEPPVQHFIVTDVDFSDAMAAAAALMAQDTAEAPATAATAAKEDETPRETAAKEDETPRETAANDGDANDGDGTTGAERQRRRRGGGAATGRGSTPRSRDGGGDTRRRGPRRRRGGRSSWRRIPPTCAAPRSGWNGPRRMRARCASRCGRRRRRRGGDGRNGRRAPETTRSFRGEGHGFKRPGGTVGWFPVAVAADAKPAT